MPERNAEDEEFELLSQRFAHNHFGQPNREDHADHPKDYDRLNALREKRKFQRSAILREPLQDAVRKVKLAQNPAYLMQAFINETPEPSGPSANFVEPILMPGRCS